MYSSILVPLDGSAFSEHALPVACMLARRSGATLRLALVHVPFVTGYATGTPMIDQALDAQSRAANQAYLRAVQKRLIDRTDLKLTATMLDGPVADALARHIAATNTDLVVMTMNGRGGLARTWLGSVADALIRQLTVTALLLRPSETAPDLDRSPLLQKILIPLDGSRLAEQILEPALALGSLMQAEYRLVQVVEPATLIGYAPQAYATGLEQEMTGRHRDDAASYLDSVAGRLRSMGVRPATRVIIDRQPAVAILEYARQEGIDLIALSTRGRGGFVRLLVGSVADKVLRGADVPVLIYRPADSADSGLPDEGIRYAAGICSGLSETRHAPRIHARGGTRKEDI